MRKHYLVIALIVLATAAGIWLLQCRQKPRSGPETVPQARLSDQPGDTTISDPVKDSLLRQQAVDIFKRKWCSGLICAPLVDQVVRDKAYRRQGTYRSTRLAIIRAEYSKVVVSNDFLLVAPGGGTVGHSVLAVMDTSGRVVKFLRKE